MLVEGATLVSGSSSPSIFLSVLNQTVYEKSAELFVEAP